MDEALARYVDEISPRTSPSGAEIRTILPENNHGIRVDYAVFPAGVETPNKSHDTEDEVLFVVSGAGTFALAGTEYEIRPRSCFIIPAGTPHHYRVSSGGPFEALATFTWVRT
jgi:quercetin dioxygenase-like cupin family protein